VARTWPEHQLATEITGVNAFSPTNVWVFGGPGAFPGIGTWHLRGSTWRKVTGLAGAISTASALSRSDMWAIGADSVSPDDILLHYNGTTWQQVTGTALTGLQFERILALSDTDVWVTAAPGGGPRQQLLHFDGTQWSSVPITVPQSVQLVGITSDGSGGLWFSGFGTAAQWAVHRSATGTWSSTKLAAGSTVYNLALIPGTKSLWGAGTLAAAPGSDAAIWGHGPAT
jgi:predicted small integral membrane protein